VSTVAAVAAAAASTVVAAAVVSTVVADPSTAAVDIDVSAAAVHTVVGVNSAVQAVDARSRAGVTAAVVSLAGGVAGCCPAASSSAAEKPVGTGGFWPPGGMRGVVLATLDAGTPLLDIARRVGRSLYQRRRSVHLYHHPIAAHCAGRPPCRLNCHYIALDTQASAP
jgi:hypothetical protein